MDLEHMKREAWWEAHMEPIQLARRILDSKIRYDWSEQRSERLRYLLNICNVEASEDVTLATLSLEEAERLSSALESGDFECEDSSDALEIESIRTEIRVMLVLVRSMGPETGITPLRVFRHLNNIQTTMGTDAAIIRDIAEYVGVLAANTIMHRHHIPMDDPGIPDEEIEFREFITELLMNHVADEILAGD